MSRLLRSMAVSLAAMSLLALYPAGKALAAAPGWNKINGEWYYYEDDGTKHIGWLYSSKVWYYFDYEGVMAHDRLIVDDSGDAYYFSSSGSYVKKKWVKSDYIVGDDGNKYYSYYYFGSNGKAVSGWKKIDKKWYYFDAASPSATLTYGSYEIDGTRYVFTTSGALASGGWVKVPEKDDNGNYHYYYTTSGGVAVTGWKQVGSKWYYMAKTNKFVSIGYRLTGRQTIDGKVYIFGNDGAMMTGWYKDPDTGKWCYLKKDGTFAVSEFVTDGGKKYYFNSKGVMVTGKVTINDNVYWFEASGAMKTGWQKDSNGNWNYFGTNGVMAISTWVTTGGKKYYFNSSGIMITGKKKVAGIYYLFDDNGALLMNCWHQVASGNWYRAKADGRLYVSEWYVESGKWYYFGSTGIMAHNTKVTIDGVVYKFDKNGVCTNHP